MQTITFRRWLLSHASADSAFGDLARDLAEDACCSGDSPEIIADHIRSQHEACADALDTLNRAVSALYKIRGQGVD